MSDKTDHPMVLVEWLNPGLPSPSWMMLDNIKEPRPLKSRAVGFLLRAGQSATLLAMQMACEFDSNTWSQATGVVAIPNISITKITRLNLGG